MGRGIYYMLNKKKISILLLVVMLFTLLAGCGANKSINQSSGGNSDVFDLQEEISAPYADKMQGDHRKLIEYWNYDIEVANTNQAMTDIINKTQSLDGYIVESQVNNYEKNINAFLTVKIPQNKISEMTTYMQTVGKINDSSNRTEDVTMEYYDTQARLEVLKKQEERLLAFMDGQANNIQDLLDIEREISRVRADRESMQAQMNYLNNVTSFSQVSIHLRQHSGGEITTPQGTWGKSIQGLITSLNSLINLGNNLIILLFMAAPYLIIIIIVYFITKYIRKRKQ